MINNLKRELIALSIPEKAKVYRNFHKTDKEGYASGENFLGVTVPNIRKVALNNLYISYNDILQLLKSRVHEEKYVAAEIISGKYENYENSFNKKEIFNFYIKHADKFSGWDLVDTTASRVVGHFLFHFDKSEDNIILKNLARSNSVWKRRIAIVSTYYFIKNNQFDETLKVAEILLNDKHNLIHKAVGWMLREVGNRNQEIEERFLRRHYKKMPRTMLRYAIEKFDKKKKEFYMRK